MNVTRTQYSLITLSLVILSLLTSLVFLRAVADVALVVFSMVLIVGSKKSPVLRKLAKAFPLCYDAPGYPKDGTQFSGCCCARIRGPRLRLQIGVSAPATEEKRKPSPLARKNPPRDETEAGAVPPSLDEG
jgi:hypothetical protein